MSDLSSKLRAAQRAAASQQALARKGPLWEGPGGDGPQGGVTFSLLSRFLVCRERFRLRVVEGLAAAEGFNHRLEFGNMWHVCEEAFAKAPGDKHPKKPHEMWMWESKLQEYARDLCRAHPTDRDKIDLWYRMCRMQFPLYVEHWRRHPDVKERRPLLLEQEFSVPYRLPSGRAVRLRGKWDSVDVIGKGKAAGIYLQENKTKSDIYPPKIQQELTFDLQTMLYVVSYNSWEGGDRRNDIRGVRYNVIRRSQHRQGKKETRADFISRVEGLIKEDPAHWFMRWKVEVTPADVARFRRECLDPILEQLCDWWEWISKCRGDPFSPNDGCEGAAKHIDGGDYDRPVHSSIHWRHPYGVYNVLDEGGSSDLDECLATGSEVGLRRTDDLFPELGGG